MQIYIQFTYVQPGGYFLVALKTCKTAQTGVLHTWKLHANDGDEKICPVRAMIRLATLYGEAVELSGPLLLKVGGGCHHAASACCEYFVLFTFLFFLTFCHLDHWNPQPSSLKRPSEPWVLFLGPLWYSFIPSRWLP